MSTVITNTIHIPSLDKAYKASTLRLASNVGWLSYDQTGTPTTIEESINASSVTDFAAGQHNWNFINSMAATAEYVVSGVGAYDESSANAATTCSVQQRDAQPLATGTAYLSIHQPNSGSLDCTTNTWYLSGELA